MFIDNINISFDNKIIYDNFSIEFEDNKINCIVGSSGCGKTTLLNYISEELLKRNIKVSYVFQEERLIPWKNIFDNLRLVIKHKYKKDDLEKKIDNILEILDIKNIKFLYPDQLSGGTKQKINIARALLYEGNVILLDEPFKSLDAKIKNDVIELIRTMNKNRNITIILVSHDKNEVKSLANKVFLLKGSPVELKKSGDNTIVGDIFNSIIREE